MIGTQLKWLYNYGGKNSYTLDLYSHGALDIHEDNFLKGSLVDSAFQYNNTQDSSTDKYVYDGDRLLSDTYYHYTAAGGAVLFLTYVYTYDDKGNMLTGKELDENGKPNYTNSYTYTDKPMQGRITPIYEPLASKFLPATAKNVDNLGRMVASITFTYEFDSKGRITKATATDVSGYAASKYYGY